MQENQAEVHVSKTCSASSTGKRSALSRSKATTPFGSAERCGTSEPGMAATASSSSTSAVRMLVSWRQAERIQPTTPSFGCAIPEGDAGSTTGAVVRGA